MRKTTTPLCLTTALALSLGGCALFPGGSSEPSIRVSSTLPMGPQALASFEIGRLALRDGNYAAAIAAFSDAREEPEVMAASLNGMGVAYAELGRPDLAERYFRQAMRAAPDDSRFEANLAKLLESQAAPLLPEPTPRLAAHEGPSEPSPEVRVSHPRITVAPTLRIAVAEPTSQLARVSPNEVRLTMRTPADIEPLVERLAVVDENSVDPVAQPSDVQLETGKTVTVLATQTNASAKGGWFKADHSSKPSRAKAPAVQIVQATASLTLCEQPEQERFSPEMDEISNAGSSFAGLVSGGWGASRPSLTASLLDELDQTASSVDDAPEGSPQVVHGYPGAGMINSGMMGDDLLAQASFAMPMSY